MKRKWLIMAVAWLLAASPLHAEQAPDALPQVSVLADGSLTLPLSLIVRQYAKQNNGTVELAFVDDQAKTNLLAEGAGADVLITMRTAWLEQLQQQGLIDVHSETPVANNTLVLAGPEKAVLTGDMARGLPVAHMLMRMGPEPAFGVPHPENLPEGSYARAALRHLDREGDMEPYTLYVKQRPQLVSLVKNQNAFAVMLATEALQQNLQPVWPLPASAYPPIHYRAVVLAGDNMKEARRFIEYLSSPDARAVFVQFGFGTK